MKRNIPNIFTSLNLLAGAIATVFAFEGNYQWVVAWVFIAALFDFSDGLSARILKAYSPLGKELDSLADLISFGFAPSVAVFTFLKDNVARISSNDIVCEFLPYIAFLLAVFSALRLAKFNIDKRQTESFIGLNTPANALFWTSFICGLTYDVLYISPGLMYTVLIAIAVFCILMVSEIPMFSFKIKSLKFGGNESRYFLVLFTIGLTVYLRTLGDTSGILGIAGGILLYIALSLINNRTKMDAE